MSQPYLLITLGYINLFIFWHNSILFATVFLLLPGFVFREQAHEHDMEYSKEILLVHFGLIESADIIAELKKYVKILKEREIWKLGQSKKFHFRMEKTRVPKHKTLYKLEVVGESFYWERMITILLQLAST